MGKNIFVRLIQKGAHAGKRDLSDSKKALRQRKLKASVKRQGLEGTSAFDRTAIRTGKVAQPVKRTVKSGYSSAKSGASKVRGGISDAIARRNARNQAKKQAGRWSGNPEYERSNVVTPPYRQQRRIAATTSKSLTVVPARTSGKVQKKEWKPDIVIDTTATKKRTVRKLKPQTDLRPQTEVVVYRPRKRKVDKLDKFQRDLLTPPKSWF